MSVRKSHHGSRFGYGWGRSKQQEHCIATLDELQQIWRAVAEHELAELREVHARYDEFKALPLIVFPD